MNKFGSTLRGADSLESSTRLLMGFVGGLLVVAIGKSLEGSRNEVWLTALMVILVTTSFGQVIPAGAYNGLVSGLFYNFFFIGSGGELSFHSAGEWRLELIFAGIGIAAAIIGRVVPRSAMSSHSTRDREATDSDKPYLWHPDRAAGNSSQNGGNSWMS